MKIEIITYNIVTLNINNIMYPFIIGVYNYNCFKHFYLEKTDEKDLLKLSEKCINLINTSLEYLFLLNKNKSNIIYIHKLDRFDSIFIMKYFDSKYYQIKILSHQNNIYKISIWDLNNKDNKLHLIDSYKILSMDLEKAIIAFSIKLNQQNKKINEYSYTFFEIWKKEIKFQIIKKVKNNCLSLYKIMKIFILEIYSTYKIKPDKYLTISSLSFKIWNFYNTKNSFIIESNIFKKKWKDDFIRQSYFGGRNEVYKPFVKDAYFYDINSFYPYIMYNKEFPIGDGIYIIWDNKKYNLNNFIGFLKCKIKSPNNLKIPVLPRRLENNLIYYTLGDWEGVYYIEEILLAIKMGYIITPIEGIMYLNKAKIFNEFISNLYKKRVEAKNPYIALIYKTLMNSGSGRWGMHLNDINQKIVNAEELDDLLNNKKNINIIFRSIGKDKYFVEYKDKALMYQSQSSVQISAAITSYARCYIYEFMLQLKADNIQVYYMDTDSVVIDSVLTANVSEKLGDWKLVTKIKKGYFIDQKIYYILKDNKEIIIKFKGLNSIYFKDWNESNFKNFLMYDNLDNNLIKLNNVSRIQRDFNNFNILKLESKYIRCIEYDKRLKVYKNSEWIDTIPLFYKI